MPPPFIPGGLSSLEPGRLVTHVMGVGGFVVLGEGLDFPFRSVCGLPFYFVPYFMRTGLACLS